MTAGLLERAGVSMRDLHERVARDDFQRWQGHVTAAAGCSRPVRLHGVIHEVEQATGRIVGTTSTQDMPDGVIYKPCGNRRASVCPSCSEVYRADTFQLVKAGLAGGCVRWFPSSWCS